MGRRRASPERGEDEDAPLWHGSKWPPKKKYKKMASMCTPYCVQLPCVRPERKVSILFFHTTRQKEKKKKKIFPSLLFFLPIKVRTGTKEKGKFFDSNREKKK